MATDPYAPPQAPVTDTEDTECLEYASFLLRFVATIIDSVLLLLITEPVLYVIYGVEYYDSDVLIMGGWDVLVGYVLPALLVISFWRRYGATPGKMLLGIRVIDEATGQPPAVHRCLARYIGYGISSLPLLLGYLWMLWDPEKQTWHDKLAGTVVVRS